MTHDIYIVKTRTNKHKQTDVLLLFNKVYSNKQQEKYCVSRGKDMFFKWRRQYRDRTGSDRTVSRIGSGTGSQKKRFERKKIQRNQIVYELVINKK